LRAVGEDAILTVVEAIDLAAPIHIHIAEQEKEVVDCVEWSGKRPVEYLLDRLPVDKRWCLIHATHMTGEEIRGAACSGAIAGLCSTTEANLGDGLFDLPGWLSSDGAAGIGSDSHVSISPVEELRLLEYGQRQLDRRRNIVAQPAVSTGQRLLNLAVTGGAQALGRVGKSGETGLCPGARADIVVLDPDSPIFAGQSPESLIESWIFSGNVPVVSDVFVGGLHVIKGGHHPREELIARKYQKTLTALMN
jgi:formimidoylglutamate deiminase